MSTKVITVNKKAKFNYELFDLYEAGIELTGPEIKSIRHGDVSINEAFVLIRHNEVQIINMYVKKYSYANYVHDLDPERNRRLLLHKKEILRLAKNVQMQRLSLVPTKLY
jgi:SsrA-binding protein